MLLNKVLRRFFVAEYNKLLWFLFVGKFLPELSFVSHTGSHKSHKLFGSLCKVQGDDTIIKRKASNTFANQSLKKTAFSLIELMISLITISVIAAAFTPVITKKLSASSITVGSMGGGGITEFAPDCSTWGDDCTLCTSKSCALCVKVCASNEYVNTKDCTCIGCAEVAQNCASCTKDICTKCKDGYYLNNNVCSTCASKYGEYCATCNASQCLTCKTDYELSEDPTTNEACVLNWCSGDTLAKIGNLCVTRYNMGDGGLPANKTTGNCWRPSNPCTDLYTSYSGCGRYLCDYNAANSICINATINGKTGWRLPTQEEASAWSGHIGYNENGLQFCYGGLNSYVNGCDRYRGCSGSWDNYCHTANIWVFTNISNNYRLLVRTLDGTTTDTTTDLYYYAFSVRCVRTIE